MPGTSACSSLSACSGNHVCNVSGVSTLPTAGARVVLESRAGGPSALDADQRGRFPRTRAGSTCVRFARSDRGLGRRCGGGRGSRPQAAVRGELRVLRAWASDRLVGRDASVSTTTGGQPVADGGRRLSTRLSCLFRRAIRASLRHHREAVGAVVRLHRADGSERDSRGGLDRVVAASRLHGGEPGRCQPGRAAARARATRRSRPGSARPAAGSDQPTCALDWR